MSSSDNAGAGPGLPPRSSRGRGYQPRGSSPRGRGASNPRGRGFATASPRGRVFTNSSLRGASNANDSPRGASNGTPHNSNFQSRSPPKPLPQHHLRPPTFQTYGHIFYGLLTDPKVSTFRRDLICQDFEKLPLEKQLMEFQRSLEIPAEEKDHRRKIVNDLRIILRKEFPDVQVYAFGSFLTGLGDSTSDVDLYIDAYGTSEGRQSAPAGACPLDVLESCYRCLRRAGFCRQLVPIREARVPILKVTHYSNINLDLSFENLTSLRNSQMIMLYMKLSPVVKPLCVFIRYWARFHCLTGSNSIKNYGLILMILVFLAIKKIVPPVAELQRLKDLERQGVRPKKSKILSPRDKDLIEGWNTAFIEDIEVIRTECAEYLCTDDTHGSFVGTVLKLMQEFFEMYADFEFVENMICSYNGTVLPRVSFVAGNEEDLPEYLERYKAWAVRQPMNRRLNIKTPLCIQDPFILSFNVGGPTPFGTLLKFQIACKEAAFILRNKITSLLDLMIPLPREVGDRKFLNMQERQRRTIELRQEIDHFIKTGAMLNERDSLSPDEKTEGWPTGLHKLSLDELISKNSVRFGRGWESLLDFGPSDDFRQLFAKTIISHGIHKKNSRSFLVRKLKTLWLKIINDFINDFWTECLNLKVKREERSFPERLYADPPFSVRTRKNYEDLFVDKFAKTKNKTYDVTEYQEEFLYQEVMELGNLEEKLSFIRLDCESTFPVWQNRMRILDELMAMRKPNPTAEPTTSSKKPLKPSSRERKKFRKFKHDFENEDVFKIQKQVTTNIIAKLLSKETPRKPGELPPKIAKPILKFTVFIKIDSSFVDDLPVAYFIFDKHPDTPTEVYNQGMPVIVDTITEIMESYTMFRLKQFLDIPEEAPTVSPETYFQQNRDEWGNSEDFDLLMPPSTSSSECSSPPLITGDAEDEFVAQLTMVD